jgi:hypothetical protein
MSFGLRYLPLNSYSDISFDIESAFRPPSGF